MANNDLAERSKAAAERAYEATLELFKAIHPTGVPLVLVGVANSRIIAVPLIKHDKTVLHALFSYLGRLAQHDHFEENSKEFDMYPKPEA